MKMAKEHESNVINNRKCRKLQKTKGNFKVHKKVCLMAKIASAFKRRMTEELRTQSSKLQEVEVILFNPTMQYWCFEW